MKFFTRNRLCVCVRRPRQEERYANGPVVGRDAGGHRVRVPGRYVGQGADDGHAGAGAGGRVRAEGPPTERPHERQDVALRDHRQAGGHLRPRPSRDARRVRVLVGPVQLRAAPDGRGRRRRRRSALLRGGRPRPSAIAAAARSRRRARGRRCRAGTTAHGGHHGRRGRQRRDERGPIAVSAVAHHVHTDQRRLTDGYIGGTFLLIYFIRYNFVYV